ncbi:MAG: LamG domain-containing protein [Candidatus Diapherotrites archaeon]|nr:LamG domain-containing protein [Candidatus Diapherotrites archaeon]
MRSESGQGSLEYLLLIGAAVLLAAIAIILLSGAAQMGKEKTESSEQELADASAPLRALATGEFGTPTFQGLIYHCEFDDSLECADFDKNPVFPGQSAGTTYVPGITGKGLVVDDAHATILAYNTAGNFQLEGGTVLMFFKPAWNPLDGKAHTFFDLSKGGKYFYLSKSSSNNDVTAVEKIVFGLETSDDSDYRLFADPAKIKPNQWNFIAATWKYGSGGKMVVYLNNEKIAEGDTSSQGRKLSDPGQTHPEGQVNNEMFVGYTTNLYNSGPFNAQTLGIKGRVEGEIDELQIYRRPLIETEIRQIYNHFNK